VVFYLSIFVSKEDQAALRRQTTECVKNLRVSHQTIFKHLFDFFYFFESLKLKFKEIQFEVIGFECESHRRTLVLRQADLICYVCGSICEVESLDTKMSLGMSAFHHDYNKIHFVRRFAQKSINITFEKCTRFRESHSKARSFFLALPGELNKLDEFILCPSEVEALVHSGSVTLVELSQRRVLPLLWLTAVNKLVYFLSKCKSTNKKESLCVFEYTGQPLDGDFLIIPDAEENEEHEVAPCQGQP
jgi:hypothetical protein